MKETLKELKLKALMVQMIHELHEQEDYENDSVAACIGKSKAIHKELANPERRVTARDLDEDAKALAGAMCHQEFAEFLHEFCNKWLETIKEL